MNRDLQSLFLKARQRLPFTTVMELLEAVAGRKVSRLAFSENNVPWLDDLLTEFGAHWQPAYAPFYHTPDQGKGEWSSRSEQSESSPNLRHRSWQIYIAKYPELALQARDMEAAHDERELGLVLGIPPCCIDFYIRHREAARLTQNDYTLHSAKKTGQLFDLPHWNNTLTQYFGVSLLSFAPCTYRCSAARQYAQQRWASARNVAPQEADSVLARQVCAGLYTEFEGVHLFNVLSSTADLLRIDPSSVLSTQPHGQWAKDLREANDIRWDPQTGQLSLMGNSGLLRLKQSATTALLQFRAIE